MFITVLDHKTRLFSSLPQCLIMMHDTSLSILTSHTHVDASPDWSQNAKDEQLTISIQCLCLIACHKRTTDVACRFLRLFSSSRCSLCCITDPHVACSCCITWPITKKLRMNSFTHLLICLIYVIRISLFRLSVPAFCHVKHVGRSAVSCEGYQRPTL